MNSTVVTEARTVAKHSSVLSGKRCTVLIVRTINTVLYICIYMKTLTALELSRLRTRQRLGQEGRGDPPTTRLGRRRGGLEGRGRPMSRGAFYHQKFLLFYEPASSIQASENCASWEGGVQNPSNCVKRMPLRFRTVVRRSKRAPSFEQKLPSFVSSFFALFILGVYCMYIIQYEYSYFVFVVVCRNQKVNEWGVAG